MTLDAYGGKGWGWACAVGVALGAVLAASGGPARASGAKNAAEAKRSADGKTYLIVTRQLFADAVGRLAAYRRDSGYDVVVGVWERIAANREAPPRAEDIKTWIDETARSRGARPSVIVLCGDETRSPDAKAPWRMPSFRKPLYRWRKKQRTTFTSDAAYGDMDGDDLPDVAVGRLSVRTGEQVLAYIDKLRRYETRQDGPDWLRTVVWMGIPGYDPRSDAMMTPIGMQAVRRYLPDVLTCWWLSGDPQWPCWLPPDEQARRFLSEMAGGSVVNLFGGHGSASKALANVSKAARTAMTIDDLCHLPADRPIGPLVFLACTIGRFEWDKGPCLGEAMWHHPGGPIVVVAASTESHPLTNYYSAIALAKMLGRRPGTVGEWWVQAQRIGFRERAPLIEAMLKDAEGKLEPQINVPKLRRDQPLMYGLLGDPACRFRLPRPLDPQVHRRGDQLTVRAALPAGVRRVAVDVLLPHPRRNAFALDVPTTQRALSDAERAARRDKLERFNARCIPVCAMSASHGPFEVTRPLPSELKQAEGSARVRLAAFGDRGQTWAGVAEIPAGQEDAGR